MDERAMSRAIWLAWRNSLAAVERIDAAGLAVNESTVADAKVKLRSTFAQMCPLNMVSEQMRHLAFFLGSDSRF
jgi:ABC-type transporter Mla MlaB component